MTTNLHALWRLLRPHQWLKNAFVLLGIFFAHAWSDLALLGAVALAVLGFCLVSSFVYVINDLSDVAADRLHPHKRHRPLAAGTVTPRAALLLSGVLLVAGLGLGWAAGPAVALILLLYLLLNLAYSWRLKRVVILDVFIIAAGFMLRILAGTSGVGIPPSSWLLLTGLMVTLFLGFTKRRAELAVMERTGEVARKVLHNYSLPMLDVMIGVCATGVVLSYSLYTMSSETVAVHGTHNLIYTVPFLLYGLFRYLYLTMADGAGEDPSRDLLRDPHLFLTVLAWAGVTLWLFS